MKVNLTLKEMAEFAGEIEQFDALRLKSKNGKTYAFVAGEWYIKITQEIVK